MSELQRNLLAAMAEMANPVKSNTAKVPTKNGKSYSYKYESLDQVLACIRPALQRHGLGLSQGIKARSDGAVLETAVFDDLEWLVLDSRPIPEAADAQQRGSWETYLRRYALRSAFGLAGEDDDGAATVARPAAEAVKVPPEDGLRMATIEKIERMRTEWATMLGKPIAQIDEWAHQQCGNCPLDQLDLDELNAYGKQLKEFIDRLKREEA